MKAVLLAAVLALAGIQNSSSSVTGKWMWQGAAGWQRIILDFKAEGTRLKGTITMGPGSGEPATPADFWEYFFDSADFDILNGKIEGARVSFEQAVRITGASDGRFFYSGTIEGDRIVFTREAVPRLGDPWAVGTRKIQFAVQRVR